jgi:hypothetical protein
LGNAPLDAGSVAEVKHEVFIVPFSHRVPVYCRRWTRPTLANARSL